MCEMKHSSMTGMIPSDTNKTTHLNRYLTAIQRQILKLPAEDSMDLTLMGDILAYRSRRVKGPRTPGVWLSFYGFGNNQKKVLCLRLMRYALAPHFLYGSTVANDRWEAMMLLDQWRPDMDELQMLCDKFRMSIGMTELGIYLGAGMVTCYERIRAGTMIFGSVYLPRNRDHHMRLEACVEQKKLREQTRLAEEEMGVSYNLRNMLTLFRNMRNLEVENTERLQERLQLSQDLCRHIQVILHSMNFLDSMMANATQIEFGVIDAHGIHAATEENRADVVRTHITQNIQDLENITARLQASRQESSISERWTVLAGWTVLNRQA